MTSPAILFLGQSVLLMGLSVPLIQGRVKPNPFYGLRTPKSLSNDGIWYASNRLSGRALLVAGAANAGLSLLVLLLGSALAPQVQAWLLLGGMLVGVVSATVYSMRALARM